MGDEMKESFQKAGEQVKQGARQFSAESGPVIRSGGHGILHAFGVLFKVFFLFIAGVIAFALVMALIALIFSGAGILAFKGYVLKGFWENFLTWVSLALFLVIPVIALLTWLIRRIIGVRSRTHYLGYTFASLWVIGLISFIVLCGMVMNNFRYRSHVKEDLSLSMPSHGRLTIRTLAEKRDYDDGDWFFDNNDWRHNGPFYAMTEDSMVLNTVKLELVKSPDSAYHVAVIKFSHGNNSAIAREFAQQIVFSPVQADSVLSLPDGFTINRESKFRNQQVLVAVSIPLGRRVIVNRNIGNYRWFNIDIRRRHFHFSSNERDNDWNDYNNYNNDEENTDWGISYPWERNTEYVMTADGLVMTDKKAAAAEKELQKKDEEDRPEERKTPPPPASDKENKDGGYRYRQHKKADSSQPKAGRDSSDHRAAATTLKDEHDNICLLFMSI